MTARHSLSPYSLLSGFVLLLAALFGVAYAVGSAAGPVSPGMHRSDGGGASDPDSGQSGGSGGMDGMPGMGH
ncbi:MULTISPECIES: hypothetical protein [Streptomyces]|uniref:hypothetical protein n=1 Tax=Streptomyces TaxID=1883 RepID=UPI00163D15BD|nr:MULTISPECIES: hypothetical protein [Streptomyces]MBC2879295.1 hypothetical protein [Streptomyces sp. TYQ1024]UBI40107.1 hypothetical protein K7I03_29045 [Streptomyces mobaraensis]UKW32686.1 hypothetical protein MCU78_28975 [Streptomyces sp. TYQ1024]